MNLNTKLTLYLTLSKLAIVAVFLLSLPYIFNWIAQTSINTYLRQQEAKVFQTIKANGLAYYMPEGVSYGSYTMLKEEYISMESIAPEVPDVDEIADGWRLVESDTLNYRILSRTFIYEDQRYLLEIGRTTATIKQYSTAIRRIALYVLIGLVMVTMVLDFFFSRIILRPLGKIIRTRLLGQQFPFKAGLAPIRTSTSDFKLLDKSFIQLMEKIREDFDREKAFTANASHELLTPISVLKSKIENLMLAAELDERVAAKLAEMMHTLNRLSGIVKSMLLIARIDNAQFDKVAAVRIDQLVDEIAEELAIPMDEKDITYVNSMTRKTAIPNLNRELMRHLFSNLMRNAVRYNKSGGRIELADSVEAGRYWVHIRDTGIGFPAAQYDQIFDRFKMVHHYAGGFGLGLSIVRSIAKFFAIEIRVESTEGKGSLFSVGFENDK